MKEEEKDIKITEINYIPVIYKMFDEIIVNARDQRERLKDIKDSQPVTEIKVTINEETGEIETVEITENVITQTAIEPLEATVEVTETDPETMEPTTTTVRNPLIVKDEEERAAAQAVIDATPQSVIDAINS